MPGLLAEMTLERRLERRRREEQDHRLRRVGVKVGRRSRAKVTAEDGRPSDVLDRGPETWPGRPPLVVR
jgi:hypothetical protein